MSPPSNAVDAEGGNAKDDTSEKRHNSVPTRRNDDDDAKPYILSNELGKGSFATVYKGYHEVSRCCKPDVFYDSSVLLG